jgi:predicted hydrocarbon binding protein
MNRPGWQGSPVSGPETYTFRYDPEKEILENTLLMSRVMVLDADFIKALSSSLTKTFQTGATVILYHMGLAYGELLGQRILESGGLSTQTQNAYRQRYASLAIGKFKWPSLAALAASGAPAQLTVTLGDSFFAKSIGRTGQPECHVVRGILEGTAKVILKKDYQCQEVKCLSKGDQFCEFLIQPHAKS